MAFRWFLAANSILKPPKNHPEKNPQKAKDQSWKTAKKQHILKEIK
jgi:hypothetical protein